MVRYTDENGKVHELDFNPIRDPYSDVFNIARTRARELREMGYKLGEEIVYNALTYFANGYKDDPPHMEDAKADALLQAIIKEAREEGGWNEQVSFR